MRKWQKSSYSSEASNCVEIAANERSAVLHLRESDDPQTILTTTPHRLAALLGAARRGVLADAAGG
ncbi:DUF397 domain-containing protein [Streptomyces sp. JJ66]|uniref:DUF397 domain-containing protein n=1 Tax=Streptomyces sp. JJ66 TaxID=2803843 RepID=UPI001C55D06C|nr:DUF397 domain-containing protein [Streptomyces sp. JJ66]MBW1602797.1 DUF397 domain-containing protein [Streptomyces sp. JJ66]